MVDFVAFGTRARSHSDLRDRQAPEGPAGAEPNGVVIVRHGVLVYEKYFVGADQRWPENHWGEPLPILPHDAETKHDMSSSTKSVVALLVGIALDRGALKSLDTPAFDFFPEYADLRSPERDAITVRDLLTMRAGLRWIYHPYLSFWRQINAAPDPYRLILAQPVTATPGTVFRYNNGSVELMGAIIQRAMHRPLDEFAKEALFDPLGITDWEWGRMANGDPGASWGLRLRLRDFAKIGQLVLSHGRWHGRQIVSEERVKDMTAPQVTRREGAYGYYWWLELDDNRGSTDRPHRGARLGWSKPLRGPKPRPDRCRHCRRVYLRWEGSAGPCPRDCQGHGVAGSSRRLTAFK